MKEKRRGFYSHMSVQASKKNRDDTRKGVTCKKISNDGRRETKLKVA